MKKEVIMLNINEMLEQCRTGEAVHSSEILDYINKFKQIVLRGAGNFGSTFGALLMTSGIFPEKICYWDNRASELSEVNGVKVYIPFSCEFDPEKTLIINCIPNGSLSGSVGEQESVNAGYCHTVSGMALFEALMCNLDLENGLDPGVCLKTTFCNWCACKRLTNMLLKQAKNNHHAIFDDELTFPVMTFVINQKCTLGCKHCGQFISHYKPEERINFSLERIKDRKSTRLNSSHRL